MKLFVEAFFVPQWLGYLWWIYHIWVLVQGIPEAVDIHGIKLLETVLFLNLGSPHMCLADIEDKDIKGENQYKIFLLFQARLNPV